MVKSAEKLAKKAEKAARKHAQKQPGKRHDQRGIEAPAVQEQAAEVIAKVKEAVTADHALGHKVKELRDGGMAWWQIAYQLELPGSGPNVAQGKSGAARARALYKKTFGELPGDIVARSTKASRAAGDGAVPVVRKPQFNEDQLAWDLSDAALAEANAEILERVGGKEIRWVGHTPCADGSILETERECRVHPDGITIERAEGKPTVLHFREYEKGDRRAQQWRSVRLADVYDIRR